MRASVELPACRELVDCCQAPFLVAIAVLRSLWPRSRGCVVPVAYSLADGAAAWVASRRTGVAEARILDSEGTA
jgi:hypothetical protein